MAALWTAPVVWGRVPIVGNVGLEILSLRMVQGLGGSAFDLGQRLRREGSPEGGDEKLMVRWRTIGKNNNNNAQQHDTVDSGRHRNFSPHIFFNQSYAKEEEGGGGGGREKRDQKGDVGKGKDFTGLFIFTFDERGRVLSHTIEHAMDDYLHPEEDEEWDSAGGTMVGSPTAAATATAFGGSTAGTVGTAGAASDALPLGGLMMSWTCTRTRV